MSGAVRIAAPSRPSAKSALRCPKVAPAKLCERLVARTSGLHLRAVGDAFGPVVLVPNISPAPCPEPPLRKGGEAHRTRVPGVLDLAEFLTFSTIARSFPRYCHLMSARNLQSRVTCSPSNSRQYCSFFVLFNGRLLPYHDVSFWRGSRPRWRPTYVGTHALCASVLCR